MGFEQACDSMHAAAVLGGDQNATANAHPCLTSDHHGVNNSDSNVSNQTGAVAGASGRRTSGGVLKQGLRCSLLTLRIGCAPVPTHHF